MEYFVLRSVNIPVLNGNSPETEKIRTVGFRCKQVLLYILLIIVCKAVLHVQKTI